jgi:hypothetical protein
MLVFSRSEWSVMSQDAEHKIFAGRESVPFLTTNQPLPNKFFNTNSLPAMTIVKVVSSPPHFFSSRGPLLSHPHGSFHPKTKEIIFKGKGKCIPTAWQIQRVHVRGCLNVRSARRKRFLRRRPDSRWDTCPVWACDGVGGQSTGKATGRGGQIPFCAFSLSPTSLGVGTSTTKPFPNSISISQVSLVALRVAD